MAGVTCCFESEHHRQPVLARQALLDLIDSEYEIGVGLLDDFGECARQGR